MNNYLDNTSSYILADKNRKLVTFILDEINKCTYFNVPSISKQYIFEILGIKYKDIERTLQRSMSIRVGHITKELLKLGIIVRHRESKRSVWRNLYKDNLHEVLNKKMEQNYFLIKMVK